jgi:[acyl-carrier-protein] S-malonyltransferase
VRWTATVQAIAGRGITDIVEAGPGRVLAGLARKIDANLKAHALSDGNGLADAKAALG